MSIQFVPEDARLSAYVIYSLITGDALGLSHETDPGYQEVAVILSSIGH